MSSEKQLNLFFGHHKCATTWVRILIGRLCNLRKEKWAVFDNSRQFDHDLARTVKAKELDFVAYTNANKRYLKELGDFRGFHIIRDPRDILVSAYFSHRNSHPTEGWDALISHRERLKSLPMEEGLLAEMDFSESVFEDIFTWDYDQENVLELHFEDLVSNPCQTMLDAFSFLGMISSEPITTGEYLTLALGQATQFLEGRAKGRLHALGRFDLVPAQVLLGTVHEHRFERITGGRKRGVEVRDNHYRKGEPGDWKNHFTPRVASAFNERYGTLMTRLNYE